MCKLRLKVLGVLMNENRTLPSLSLLATTADVSCVPYEYRQDQSPTFAARLEGLRGWLMVADQRSGIGAATLFERCKRATSRYRASMP